LNLDAFGLAELLELRVLFGWKFFQGLLVEWNYCEERRNLARTDREVANAFDAAVTACGKKKRDNKDYPNIRIEYRLGQNCIAKLYRRKWLVGSVQFCVLAEARGRT